MDKAEDVTAGRTAEDLLKYVNKKTGFSKKLKAAESSVSTLTDETFKSVALSKSNAALVGFFAPWYVTLVPIFKVGRVVSMRVDFRVQRGERVLF